MMIQYVAIISAFGQVRQRKQAVRSNEAPPADVRHLTSANQTTDQNNGAVAPSYQLIAQPIKTAAQLPPLSTNQATNQSDTKSRKNRMTA